MQTQLKSPEQYKDVREFDEAVRHERLAAVQCPNGCVPLLDIESFANGTSVVLSCLCCGFLFTSLQYLMPQLHQVGEA